MELRPRKGRSAQPPSIPTIAKPSPRPPPQSSSRKKPASTPIHIPSDDEDTDQICADPKAVDAASKDIHVDEVENGSSEFETSLSSILRRAHKKVASSNVKAKIKVTSSVKKKMAEEMGSTPVADTHDRIATTSENVGFMTKKVFGTPNGDIASEETDKQEALTGSVPQNSDELAVEITLLAQDVCLKKTEVLSPSSDSKQVHSSKMKSAKKNDEETEVVKRMKSAKKLERGGDQKHIVDVDAPILSESQAFSLILSDDETVLVSDAVQVDGCEENISASIIEVEKYAERVISVSERPSFKSPSASLRGRDEADFEMVDSDGDKLDASDTGIQGTDIVNDGVQEVSKKSSDEDSRDERHVDIRNDHAKLDATIACSQKNVLHDEELSNSDGDDGNASSGSDDDDEDEMASVFFSSMKAHLQKISEPSGLNMQKDERAKQDALIRLESQLTKSAVKKPSANGGSTGYGLSWSPEIVLSASKTSKAQVGKPRSVVEARPDTIWGKDRCLQDGLCVPPVDPLKLNKLARKQKDDTTGAKWFNLSAPTITPEIKKELQLVKLRGALDPKRHYKADDSKGLPKYFQVGTVVGGPADFYSGRLTKKEQKSSLASELLSDSSLTAYRKRKYTEIQDQKQAGGKGFWKKKRSKRTPAWAKI